MKEQRYVQVIRDNADYFPARFDSWVSENHHIMSEFERETHRVIKRGFHHYGAHVIVQVIRHYTNLRAVDESGFKIKNDVFPYLARVFAILNPTVDYIFDYRHTNTKKQFVPACMRITDPKLIEFVLSERAKRKLRAQLTKKPRKKQ